MVPGHVIIIEGDGIENVWPVVILFASFVSDRLLIDSRAYPRRRFSESPLGHGPTGQATISGVA